MMRGTMVFTGRAVHYTIEELPKSDNRMKWRAHWNHPFLSSVSCEMFLEADNPERKVKDTIVKEMHVWSSYEGRRIDL